MRENQWMPRTARMAACLACALAVWAGSPVQAQECSSDEDCDEGYSCALSFGGASSSDCRPGEECPEPELVIEDGSCERDPIACSQDADCPLGLSCQQSDVAVRCASDAAGEESCDDVADAPSICVYAPVACESDDECDAGYECSSLGGESRCFSEPCSADDPDCTTEEVCETRELQVCFPLRLDCATQADCDDGYECTELPDNAQDDAPAGWEDATQVCIPAGIALTVTGEVPVRGALGGGASAADSADSLASSREAAMAGAAGSGAAGADDGGGGEASNGGCSVGTRGRHGGGAAAMFALLGLAVLLRRRRR